MKKLLAVFFAAICIFALCACSDKGEVASDTPDVQTQKPIEAPDEVKQPEAEEAPEATIPEKWGVEDKLVPGKSYDQYNATYLSYPQLTPITKGKGRVAYQNDNTLVLVAMQLPSDEIPAPEAIDGAFDAYKYKFESVMFNYRSSAYDNFDFVADSSEAVEVNGYKMIKYLGKHTFTHDGNAQEMAFAAYTTKTLLNDAYLCWMVIDETEDQSMGETIISHADNMAKSLREEEF